MFLSGEFSKNDWFIDSGASSHMCMHKEWFKSLNTSNITEISTANDSKMCVGGIGNVELIIGNKNSSMKVEVKDVLYSMYPI